jgi:hypothetical protein
MLVTLEVFYFFLCLAVFFAIRLGCFANCFPAAVAFRFVLVVAAYSDADSSFIAASGKYRSPVLPEGFPDFVRHFCFVHFSKLF